MVKELFVLDELVRASALLADEGDFKSLISVLVEQSLDITRSDLAALYLFKNPENKNSDLKLMYKRGAFEVANELLADTELVEFINECEKSVVLQERKPGPFDDLFVHPLMNSGIALPLKTSKSRIGILILNSRKALFYNKNSFNFLDSYTKQASGMLQNSRLYRELKDYVKKIEDLERYQESIFESMTNILITTDENNKIEYFNHIAEESMGLDEESIGVPLSQYFKKNLSRKVLNATEKVGATGQEILGMEGIYKRNNDERDMDFSLNVSALKGVRGKHKGLTLLFTDQTREQELKATAKVATEDRRVIKDMFARYLSNDIVQNLMDSPEMVKPGGGTKHATVFFADIRGYTSFSEDKSPEYIIEVLNEYFSEAVEIVIKYGGYIDKFIGDCIMAAWGVPMVNETEDAVKAVSCAVEIQNLVKDKDRQFFKGKAESLKVGFGMHTGDLVAGNLGSSRRMDYTVIGDTVNLAARLEGVSEAGEIIITEDTRKHLDDRFIIESRDAVKVKGKIKPIQIYNVVGMR
ncbi:PAS domain S-box protein [Oceanispirochaeta crateris]|uniref:PAS domain S-box protein n=2 Tax=Oceanispirochaeta crateris TaxID=2518645 RepID=A0A5C1QQP8_9SPIO|nr:PAS domain S-box protein [Oceanispirochaeta crateris]